MTSARGAAIGAGGPSTRPANEQSKHFTAHGTETVIAVELFLVRGQTRTLLRPVSGRKNVARESRGCGSRFRTPVAAVAKIYRIGAALFVALRLIYRENPLMNASAAAH